jgi:hypothetical protein
MKVTSRAFTILELIERIEPRPEPAPETRAGRRGSTGRSGLPEAARGIEARRRKVTS